MDQHEAIGQAVLSHLVEARRDALGRVERVAAGEQVARVEAQPKPWVVDHLEQPRGLGDRGGDRAHGSGHELDDESRLAGLGRRTQALRGPLQRPLGLLRPARAGVDDQSLSAELLGRDHRGSGQLHRLRQELRDRRCDVHEIRRVEEQRPEAGLLPCRPELLRPLVRVRRVPPLARVRGEHLHRLGRLLHGDLRRREHAALRPDVGSDDHRIEGSRGQAT